MSDDVLAVAEHRRGDVREVTYELITAGRRLADGAGGDLHVALVSGDVEGHAHRVVREGVDRVHTVSYGAEFNHDVYVQAVEALYAHLEPTYVVMPNSANGLNYAPAVANSLDLPLVPDATDVEHDGGLTATREMYESKVETTVTVDRERAAVTVRGGAFDPAHDTGDAEVTPFDFDPDEGRIRSDVLGFEEIAAGDVDIAEADVLVGVGRGIGEGENMELVEALADALGATLAASRPVVDSGWLPKSRQVGQSGKTVAPDVYIAVGISGAVQHVAGVRGADTVVAINNDPDAPIFDVADYGVVGDLFEVVPALVEQFT